MKELHGNIVVGQSGGPTAAINATLAGVIRGGLDGIAARTIGKIYGMRNGVEGLLEERLVDLGALFDSDEKLRRLEHTPAPAVKSCRNAATIPQYTKNCLRCSKSTISDISFTLAATIQWIPPQSSRSTPARMNTKCA